MRIAIRRSLDYSGLPTQIITPTSVVGSGRTRSTTDGQLSTILRPTTPDIKKKRVASDTLPTQLSSVFNSPRNSLDAPDSPLSSPASDISDWPEARLEKRLKTDTDARDGEHKPHRKAKNTAKFLIPPTSAQKSAKPSTQGVGISSPTPLGGRARKPTAEVLANKSLGLIAVSRTKTAAVTGSRRKITSRSPAKSPGCSGQKSTRRKSAPQLVNTIFAEPDSLNTVEAKQPQQECGTTCTTRFAPLASSTDDQTHVHSRPEDGSISLGPTGQNNKPGNGTGHTPLPSQERLRSTTLPLYPSQTGTGEIAPDQLREHPQMEVVETSFPNPPDIRVVDDTSTSTLVSQRWPAHQALPKTVEYNAVYLHNAAISDDERRLTDLAEQLTTAAALLPKPAPSGQPSVWADGRQALCETVPYFRSYQGGGYCTGGFARGFMYDKESHERDYMDANIIISRAGGGLSKDKATGDMVMEKDQTEGSQVSSVRNSIFHFNPVVMIVGENNPTSPSRPPHPYCVLDWFKPTHVWFEKSQDKKIIRYRFEKLRPYDGCWWAPQQMYEPVGLGDLSPAISKQCCGCSKESLQVYIQGWMCLQPDCLLFWKLENGSEPQEACLLYDPRFMKQHTQWPHSSEPYELRPELMKINSMPTIGQDVSYAAWKGFVCPRCGRCNSRESWIGWECGNANCGFKYSLTHTLITPNLLHDPYYPLSSNYAFSRDKCLPLIKMRLDFAHNYRINYFEIPGIDGFVAHLIANRTVNEEAGGPDDMFVELQGTDIGLRRRPLQTAMLKGQMLTQHFLVNYGMPYKFIAATSSRSFDGAADAIKSTRSRLNWAARHITKEDHKEFNEVLALGYFEKQAIDYHDDGEFGLGPTIATLSLGAPATMKLRLKAKHYHGISKTGNYTEATPLPGSRHYDARKAAYDSIQSLKMTNRDAYKKKIKDLPQQLGLVKKSGKAPDAITMTLGHGDIVIMHGVGIQEFYEHAVDPSGKLRFALTCRYIDPESLKPEERPTYTVTPDEGIYDGSLLPPAA